MRSVLWISILNPLKCCLRFDLLFYGFGGTMKKKFGLFALCLSLMLTACTMPIGSQPDEPEVREEEEEEISIELSDKKVELEVGEEFEVEIENFDDLSKVKIEVEDEDIAEAEIDDEIITITALSEGKTKITVSAKGCDDVKITVKVTAPPAPEIDFPASSSYVYTYVFTGDVWFHMFDGYEDYGELSYFLGDLQVGLDFHITFTETGDNEGTAVLSYDPQQFGEEFLEKISDEENYREFVAILMEAEGLDYNEETDYEDLLDMKDVLMSSLSEMIVEELESSQNEYDLGWLLDGNTLIFDTGIGSSSSEINESDGSFTIFIPESYFEDEYVFDGDFTMIFVPEK